MKHPYIGSYRTASPYGYRIDPITGKSGTWHGGIDLVGEDKTVVSVSSGVVLQSRIITDSANRTSEWGNYIAIQSDSGDVMYYCHLSSRAVEKGQSVEIGQIIGIEGSSGRSMGSHLHFEIRRNGVQIDPAAYLGIPNTAGFVYMPEEVHDPDDSLPNDWSEAAVRWALDNGIMLGNPNGDLKLRSHCTREEAVVMLYRLWHYFSLHKGGEQ